MTNIDRRSFVHLWPEMVHLRPNKLKKTQIWPHTQAWLTFFKMLAGSNVSPSCLWDIFNDVVWSTWSNRPQNDQIDPRMIKWMSGWSFGRQNNHSDHTKWSLQKTDRGPLLQRFTDIIPPWSLFMFPKTTTSKYALRYQLTLIRSMSIWSFWHDPCKQYYVNLVFLTWPMSIWSFWLGEN